jgi:hypothetical protein
MFGAKGDGVTNDTNAFVALGAAVTAAGGGVIDFTPGATYIVGKQTAMLGRVSPRGDLGPLYLSFKPSRILFFIGLTQGLTIRGNGAKMKAAGGLKYGTFNPITGKIIIHPLPYTGDDIAVPYEAMIACKGCSGPIDISNIELDGNFDDQIWGGPRGDVGWQLPCMGLFLSYNTGTIRIDGVDSHHHCQDALQASSVAGGRGGNISNSRFNYSGRNNLSLVGGAGWTFDTCDFNFAARHPTRFSAPAAGADLEAELSTINRAKFINCRFMHNRYSGMASDSGDINGASFDGCTFWSSAGTGVSIYLSKPNFKFTSCTFGGPFTIVGSFSPPEFPIFDRCIFIDDTARSLDGTVGTEQSHADTVGGGTFRDCVIRLNNTPTFGTASSWVYDHCYVNIQYDAPSNLSGIFKNGCQIIGPNLVNYGSFSDNTSTVNGVAVRRTIAPNLTTVTNYDAPG